MMTTQSTSNQSGAGRSPAPAPGVRIGHVYLDTRQRRLHCLNPVARQLHDEGVPFTSLTAAREGLRTLCGGEVTPGDLPLVAAWRERRPVEATFLLYRPGMATCQVTWSTAPLADAAGDLVGILGTVHCGFPEADWQAMAGLAHDLRTPLNAIGFLLAALDRGGLSEVQQRAILDGMRSAAERALRIGGELLEHCRGPAQRKRTDEPAWFALEPFLLNLVREQAGAAERKGLRLTTDLAALAGWETALDRVPLGRLLANLLVNAVRYTPAGIVALTAAWRVENEGRSLVLSVVDTGAGIAPEEQESIFQPFERGRAGRDSDVSGSGLGLAVVDRLVEQLGLGLEVTSEHGKGSAFHLVVPERVLRPGSPAAQG